jgi:radical SAM superfamily enzyme
VKSIQQQQNPHDVMRNLEQIYNENRKKKKNPFMVNKYFQNSTSTTDQVSKIASIRHGSSIHKEGKTDEE